MKDILKEIVAHKKREVADQKMLVPTALLEKSIYFETPVVSMRKYLTRPDKSGIIAEFKRRSPSKGDIQPYAKVESVSIGYMQAGSSALSVLTDQKYFGGSNRDLTEARKFNFCPILRKDFIIDEYQIIEARSIGADTVLLIAECLTSKQVADLASLGKSLGMEVLLEVHSPRQLDKVCPDVDLVGVNNRDLTTFTTSVQTSLDMADQIPREFVRISESGISHPETIGALREAGYEGFLIGEHFMSSPHPAQTCAKFITSLRQMEKAKYERAGH